MSDQTTIRINLDTRDRLKAFGSTGQSMDGIINDLLKIAEKAGTIPAQVPGPNTGFNDELTRLNDKYTNVVKSIQELQERFDNLIPGIEHQRDEIRQLFEMYGVVGSYLEELDGRLNAQEACPVVTPQTIPETAQEQEKIPDDEHDQGQEQGPDERDRLIQKVKELEESGMGVMKIAQAIGTAHTNISKIKNREKYPVVNLKQEYVTALMNLPSQKSSSEAL